MPAPKKRVASLPDQRATLAKNLPPEDLAIDAALREAWGTQRGISGHDCSAWATSIHAAHLRKSDGAAHEAFTIARSISHRLLRAFALADIAPQLPDAERNAALREAFNALKAPELDRPGFHPLQGLARFLPRDLLPDALALARSYQSSPARFSIIAALVQPLSEAEREPILREELAHISQLSGGDGSALIPLVACLTPALWRPALRIAGHLLSNRGRVRLLNELIKHLPDQFLRGLEPIAMAIDYSDEIDDPTFAARLPKSLLLKVYNANKSRGLSDRVTALTNIGEYLTAEDRDAAWRELLSETAKIINEKLRAHVLERLAPHVPKGLASAAIELLRTLHDEEYDILLPLFGSHLLSAELDEAISNALKALDEVTDEHTRVVMFRKIFPLVTSNVLSEAIAAVDEVRIMEHRSAALHALLEHSNVVLTNSSAEALLNVARGSLLEPDYVEILALIAGRCRDTDRDRIFRDAIDACLWIPEGFKSGPDLAIQTIGQHLPISMLAQAFGMIRSIELEPARTRAFALLTSYLSTAIDPQSENSTGLTIWRAFPHHKIFEIDTEEHGGKSDEVEKSSPGADYVVENTEPPVSGGIMKSKGKQSDDAKWSGILDQFQDGIGLVETAKLILGRASPGDRAQIESMVLSARNSDNAAASVHPGALINAYLENQNTTVAEAAAKLGVTRQQLYRVINADSDISAEMALKLEISFGVPAIEWLEKQAAYNVAQLRNRESAPKPRRQKRPGPKAP